MSKLLIRGKRNRVSGPLRGKIGALSLDKRSKELAESDKVNEGARLSGCRKNDVPSCVILPKKSRFLGCLEP